MFRTFKDHTHSHSLSMSIADGLIQTVTYTVDDDDDDNDVDDYDDYDDDDNDDDVHFRRPHPDCDLHC